MESYGNNIVSNIQSDKDCECIKLYKNRIAELIDQFKYIYENTEKESVKKEANKTIEKLIETCKHWIKTMELE